MKWWNRTLGIILALSMVTSSLPVVALAEAVDEPMDAQVEEVVEVAAEEAVDDADEVAQEAAEPVDEEQVVLPEEVAAPAEVTEDQTGDVEAPAAEAEPSVEADDEESAATAESPVATEDAEQEIGVAEEPVATVEEAPELTAQAAKTYSISKAKVASVGTKRWTSKAITPKPKVTYNGKTLKLNRDYTLSYKNNVKPGTATITITGKGSYKGTKTVKFTIKKIGTWKKYSAGWRYVWAAGQYPKNQFLTINGKSYRFDKNGIMLTGWQKLTVNGQRSWYYFGSDGARRSGWQSIGGTWYWFAKYGRMATGFKMIGGKRYYFGSDGAMRTGWQKINKSWYYFYSSGAMAKSCWVGDYYLGKNGAMLTNTITPDGWQVGSDGKYIAKYSTNPNSSTALYVTKFETADFKITVPNNDMWIGQWYVKKSNYYSSAYVTYDVSHQYPEPYEGGGGIRVVVTTTYSAPSRWDNYYLGQSSRGYYVWLCDAAGGSLLYHGGSGSDGKIVVK